MKTQFIQLTKPAFWLAVSMIGLLATGCGGNETPAPKPTESKPAASAPAASSSSVTETEHQKFEKKYTEMCIKGQQDNPDSPVKGDQAAGAACECMAKAISKRLSKAEAVHFLGKNEIPIDIVMMGNAASATCAQNPQ